MVQPLFYGFFKKKNIELLYDPAIPLLVLYIQRE
jgi:hypothetical protein